MKKLTLAAASLVVLASAPAFAADLGRPIARAPAVVAAPVVAGWSGFYIGGQVGYQYGYIRETDFFTSTGLATGQSDRFNPDGVVGGGHVGFNLQTGGFVWGVEGDFEGSSVRGRLNYGSSGQGVRFDQRWQSSVRGRLGFTVTPTAMIYATGGAAFSDLRYNYFGGARGDELFTGTQTGYTVGAGIEWMFAPSWSARIEYRYTDFGSVEHALTTQTLRGQAVTARQDAEFSTVRVGVSYRFGGPVGGGPVVAAY